MRKGTTPIIAVVLLLMMIILAVGATWYWVIIMQEQDREAECIGEQICTEAVISADYYCNEDDTVFQLFNATQERMENILESCPDGYIVRDVKYCIGEVITIYPNHCYQESDTCTVGEEC